MEDGGGKNDEVFRRMWKEVEGSKADETRVEEVGRTRRKEGKKETNNRGGKNDRKNKGRKRGRRGRFNRVESDR